jgi:D-sedoheptulose 7-phosphate isomerase
VDRAPIQAAADALLAAWRRGNAVYLFGNGGSAANASHLHCDLSKGLFQGIEPRLRVTCLSDGGPTMIAYANDLGWKDVFAAPLAGLVVAGDVAVGFSASGRSVNVVRALRYARTRGAVTIGLTGFDGGPVRAASDLSLHVPVRDMKVVEDVHLVVCHCLAERMLASLRGGRPGQRRRPGPRIS